jgi:hypothetical protein
MSYSPHPPSVVTDPDMQVARLAILALCCAGGWFLFRQLGKRASTPDPWDAQVAAEIEDDNATPLCHHCLTPHSPAVDFCHKCGAGVGQYTNLLPFPYLFSLGHTLRIGTCENFKRTPLTMAGFFVFGLAEYSIAFLRNTFHKNQDTPAAGQTPAETASGDN